MIKLVIIFITIYFIMSRLVNQIEFMMIVLLQLLFRIRPRRRQRRHHSSSARALGSDTRGGLDTRGIDTRALANDARHSDTTGISNDLEFDVSFKLFSSIGLVECSTVNCMAKKMAADITMCWLSV